MWVKIPNGGKVDIDAFKHLSRQGIDKTFPYYTTEQREFIFNQINDNKAIHRKNQANKGKPDTVD